MGLGKIVTGQILKQATKRATGNKINKPGKIQAIMRLPTLLRLGFALIRDSRVPLWQRAGTVGMLALVFSPLDFIGDIPLVGQFWDFTLAVVILEYFIQTAPAAVVNEHIRRLNLQNKIQLRSE